MIVMDENRKLGDSPEILGQVESLVRRDRNHPLRHHVEHVQRGTVTGPRDRPPNVFRDEETWSPDGTPSRPITTAMNGGFGDGISLVEDLQGFNYPARTI